MQGDKFFDEENYSCKFFYEILVIKKFKKTPTPDISGKKFRFTKKNVMEVDIYSENYKYS